METFEELLNRDGNDNPEYFPFKWEYKYWGDKVPQDDPEDESDYNIRVNWDKFANIHHNSEKAKKRARMAADARIKKSRMKKAKNGAYRYFSGWYVKDTRRVCEYRVVHIPAHTEEVSVFIGYRNCYDLEEGGYSVPVFEKQVRTVPARKVRRLAKSEYVDTEPYLKRASVKKKYWKRYAAKKARRVLAPDWADGSGYKKGFGMAWILR